MSASELSKEQQTARAQLFTAVLEADSVVSVRRTRDAISAQVDRATISVEDSDYLRLRTFERSREVTRGLPHFAVGEIISALLPLMLAPQLDSSASHIAHTLQLRETLRAWLEQYSESVTQLLRREVLAELLRHHRNSDSKHWLQIVDAVATSTPGLVLSLWRIARINSKASDEAIRILAGIEPLSHENVLRLLRQTSVFSSSSRIAALSRVAYAETAERMASIIQSSALDAEGGPTERTWQLLGLAGEYLRMRDSQRGSHQPLFAILEQLASHRDVRSWLALGSNLFPRCDVPSVPGLLLKLCVEDTGSRTTAEAIGSLSHTQYLFLLRSVECLLPSHIRGWLDGEARKYAQQLRRTAEASSTTPAGSHTMSDRMQHKEVVWQVLQLAGVQDAADWIDSAIRSETNGFARQAIMEAAVAFTPERLPRTVAELLRSPMPQESSAEFNADLFERIAALELASTIPSYHTLEILLSCQFHYREQALVPLAATIVTVSKSLASANPASRELVWAALADSYRSAAEPWRRTAIVQSLCQFVESYPSTALVNELWNLRQVWIENEATPTRVHSAEYCNTLIVAAMGRLNEYQHPLRVSELTMLSEGDNTLSWPSIDALVGLGLWHFDQPENWERVTSAIRRTRYSAHGILSSGGDTLWLSSVLGTLGVRNSPRSAEAIVIAIEEGSTELVLLLERFTSLTATQYGGENAFKDSGVTLALARRIAAAQMADGAIPTLWKMLHSLDASRAFSVFLENESYWTSQNRIEIARDLAFRNAHHPQANTDVVLQRLALDNAAVVHRTAFESLRSSESRFLVEVVDEGEKSHDWSARARAAVASTYLHQDPNSRAVNVDLDGRVRDGSDRLLAFLGDADPRVRRLVPELMEERRHRLAADAAVHELDRGVKHGRSTLELAPFVACLHRWGDLSHSRALAALSVEWGSFHPALGLMLHRSITAIAKRADRNKEEWQKSIRSDSMADESVMGVLAFGDVRLRCTVLLWSQRGDSVERFSGGALQLGSLNEFDRTEIFRLCSLEGGVIEVSDSRSFRIEPTFVGVEAMFFAIRD